MAARVPTPGSPAQEVGTVRSRAVAQPFQNIQAPLDAFGAAQGRNMQAAAVGLNGIANAFEKKAKDDDALLSLENSNAIATFTTDMIHNPETGLLNKAKKNAVGASKEAMQRFDDYVANLPTPQTPEAKLAQQEQILKLKAGVLRTVGEHERKQVLSYKVDQVNTAIGNGQQAMAQLYNDPIMLSRNEEVVRSQTEAAAKLQGLDADTAAQLVETNVSKGYADSIAAAVAAQDYTTAKKLLETAVAGNKLMPDELKKARVSVQSATVLGEGQKNADRIAAMKGLTPEQQLAEAKKIQDPNVRAKTEELVKSNIDVSYTLQQRALREKFSSLGKRAAAGEDVTAEATDLDPKQQAHLRAVTLEAKQLAADRNYLRPTKPEVLSDFFKVQADLNSTTNLASMTYEQLQARFEMGVSREKFEKLIVPAWDAAKVNAGRASLAKAEEVRKMSTTLPEAQVEAALSAMKITKKDNPEEYATFTLGLQARIIQQGASTPTEKFKVLLDMVNERVVYDKAEVWGGTDAELPATVLMRDKGKLETMAADLDVPRFQRELFVSATPQIMLSLRGSGMPLSRDSISAVFKALTNVHPSQQRGFLLNSGSMTAYLQSKGKKPTPANLRALWEAKMAQGITEAEE
jgi:hypothetical protein